MRRYERRRGRQQGTGRWPGQRRRLGRKVKELQPAGNDDRIARKSGFVAAGGDLDLHALRPGASQAPLQHRRVLWPGHRDPLMGIR